jgi:hypothetical protein
MSCKTCHGQGALDGSFKMPNPALPKLDATADGFKQLAKDHAQALDVMRRLTNRMADLLGESPFSTQTGSGFGCFACHVARR